jgi:DNA-binding LacI/PurR family transcriptional regulator
MALAVGEDRLSCNTSRITKYAMVKGNLLQKMRDETLPHGSLLPSDTCLADELNVSKITIRRALGDLARDGFLVRKPGVGTLVLGHKSATMTRQSSMAAQKPVLFLSCGQPPEEYSQVLGEVDRILSAHEHPLLYAGLPSTSDEEADRIRRLIRNNSVSAILMTGWVDDQVVKFVKSMGPPVLLIGSYPITESVSQVMFDFRELASNAIAMFNQAGLRRIGLLNGRKRYGAAHDLLNGFHIAIERPTCQVEFLKVEWESDDQNKKMISEFLEQIGTPAGIFADGGQLASLVSTAVELGLSIPEDIQIIGFEGPDLSGHAWPSLARFRGNWNNLSVVVYHALEQLIESKLPCTIKYLISSVFIPGDSLVIKQ